MVHSFGRSHLQWAALWHIAGSNFAVTAAAEAALSFNDTDADGTQIGNALTAYPDHATSSRIVVNRPGFYLIRANLNATQGTTGKYIKGAIWKNGADLSPEVSETLTSLTGRMDCHLRLETVQWLEPGDYLQLAVTFEANGTVADCRFEVQAVG